jgi:hypothetical protein
MPDQKTAASAPAGPPHQSTVEDPEPGTAAERAELVGVAEPAPDGEPDPDARVDEPALDAEPVPDAPVEEPAPDGERARDEAALTDEQAAAEPTSASREDDVADEASPAGVVADPEPSRDEPVADSTVDEQAHADESAPSPADSTDAAADASAGEPGPDTSAELAPGDVPGPPPAMLWAGEDREAIRERWRELQSRFVDDPHGAAAAADDLIGEAVESLTAALAEQRGQLGAWRAGGDFDTERLRVAVTGYRDFLDRVMSI